MNPSHASSALSAARCSHKEEAATESLEPAEVVYAEYFLHVDAMRPCEPVLAVDTLAECANAE